MSADLAHAASRRSSRLPLAGTRGTPPAAGARRAGRSGWRLGVGITVAALLIAQDQDTLIVNSPLRADDPGYPAYVASLVGAPLVRGDRIDVLRNGDEAFPAMLAAIDGARQRIMFESFIFEKGEAARRFADAIDRRRRRGVDVHIVLDAFGASGLDEVETQLTDGGVNDWCGSTACARGRSRSQLPDPPQGAGDRRPVAFTGGMGIADHWQGNAQDPDHGATPSSAIRGPVGARARGLVLRELDRVGRARGAGRSDEPPPAEDRVARSIVVWSIPRRRQQREAALPAGDCRRARTLDIQSPYIVLDASTAPRSTRRAGAACACGCSPRATRPTPAGEGRQPRRLRGAARQGFAIAEYQPTMMHVKAMVVDGTWSIIGSANFDNRSLELNDELTMAVAEPALAAAITRDFEADLTRSHQLEAGPWSRRPIEQKIREWFWHFFGELF